jgi:hypothetical protein
MPSNAADNVVELVSTQVGKFMTQGILETACTEIDKDMENLEWEDIDELLGPLEERLTVQLGEDAAEQIIADVESQYRQKVN